MNIPTPTLLVFCARDIFLPPFPTLSTHLVVASAQTPHPITIAKPGMLATLEDPFSLLYPGLSTEDVQGYSMAGSLLKAWDKVETVLNAEGLPAPDSFLNTPNSLDRFWTADGFGWIGSATVGAGWIPLDHFCPQGLPTALSNGIPLSTPQSAALMVAGSSMESPSQTQHRHARIRADITTILQSSGANTTLMVVDV